MKIVFLAPEFYKTWGGVGIYSLELIKELSKIKELDIHVITPKTESSQIAQNNESTLEDKITVHSISTARDNFYYNFKFQIAILRNFKGLSNKHNFNLIHSANLVNMPDIFLKFTNNKIPSITTVHTTINGQINGFLKSNLDPIKMAQSERLSLLAYPGIRSLEWIYLKRTRNLITVSNKFKDILYKNYKYSGKITSIHNGIDTKKYDFNNIDPSKAYELFPTLEGINKPIILYAGRIITQKGIDDFIKSMKFIQASGYNFHYLIAGKGDFHRLNKLITKNNLNRKNISYLGYVENQKLKYLYRLADIFVLPSYYENLPISLLEAMSMRCSCIATNVGAIDEVIDDNINGIIINPGDPKNLAKTIINLALNKDLCKKFGLNGQKKILKNFRSEVMAKKTYEVYKNIIHET
ncbi:glycosyltransferase family 4 protein [Candidatus Woesearchaeota archaeon]|nr:glycosyltransferase family 4 protein [Candidatus Woesearchaeota archaeon]